jgi:hypothetical protein
MAEKENDMSIQTQPTAAVAAKKAPTKMTLLFHVYPDARATGMIRYCSAWSRRYGRSARA